MPPSAALEEMLARLEQSPDLLQFADEARVRDSELRLAELRRRADVRGTLGLRRFEQGNDIALVAGVWLLRREAREVAAALGISGPSASRLLRW